jgi:hypothetical protein
MKLDDFIKSEAATTGLTTQACDSDGVHSHAFIIDLMGNGKTSFNANHFHPIKNGVVVMVMDDIRTAHDHNLIGAPQAPMTASYGHPEAALPQGFPASHPNVLPAAASLSSGMFGFMREGLDDVIAGDPYYAWNRLMSKTTPEEASVLSYEFQGKADEFRAKMNNLLDGLLSLCQDCKKEELKRKLASFDGLPMASAAMLPASDIGRMFESEALASAQESLYKEKASEYLKELVFEVQKIGLACEGKTYADWELEHDELLENSGESLCENAQSSVFYKASELASDLAKDLASRQDEFDELANKSPDHKTASVIATFGARLKQLREQAIDLQEWAEDQLNKSEDA